DDFLVADLARRDATLGAALVDAGLHFRRRHRLALARLVVVPAHADLLAETAQLANGVGHRAVLDVGLLDAAALADGKADVVAGQVTHAERAHGPTEGLGGLVHLLHRGALFHQQEGLTGVLLEHAVA